jgi:hypothetical protein
LNFFRSWCSFKNVCLAPKDSISIFRKTSFSCWHNQHNISGNSMWPLRIPSSGPLFTPKETSFFPHWSDLEALSAHSHPWANFHYHCPKTFHSNYQTLKRFPLAADMVLSLQCNSLFPHQIKISMFPHGFTQLYLIGKKQIWVQFPVLPWALHQPINSSLSDPVTKSRKPWRPKTLQTCNSLIISTYHNFTIGRDPLFLMLLPYRIHNNHNFHPWANKIPSIGGRSLLAT